MKKSLNGTWTLYYYDAKTTSVEYPEKLICLPNIPASVPGNVELDLSAAGLLPKDLFFGENILKAEAYETYDFWYKKTFDGIEVPQNGSVTLDFDGVDCLADYFLNGEKIGSSDNMFIPHSFDVTNILKPGVNTLYIHLRSALLAESEMDTPLYVMSNGWRRNTASAQVRKAPHSYGWDIMPRALSAGIWRDVTLNTHSDCEFKQLYVITDRFEGDTAVMRMYYDLKLDKAYVGRPLEIVYEAHCDDTVFRGSFTTEFKAGNHEFRIKDAKKWFPYGYGEAPLYRLTAYVRCGDDAVAMKKIRFGVRTVQLVRKDMLEDGENCFRFVVNGVDIVAKGSNWVPLDAYHSRDIGRLDEAMALVKDIGCNILRCWGGNVYESDAFFDKCDENGVMIWQDFAMACRLYPLTEEFLDVMRNEAKAVIERLRQHPSLVLWSGDNECDMISHGVGSAVNGGAAPSANRITREILPQAVTLYDVGRPYLASSPYVCDEIFYTGRYDKMPEDHLWGPRDYFRSDYYKSSKASFVSETGYHGCVSVESAKKFISKDALWPCTDNREWNLHSTDQHNNPGRVNLMIKQISNLFGEVPETFEDFSLASQISQAEAKKYFIERVRTMTPRTGGIIWWNLLDGWPQFSDAVVDYYFDKKLAYSYIRRSQSPFAVMCGDYASHAIPVYAANDTLEEKTGHVKAYDGMTEEVLYEGDYAVGANRLTQIGSIKADYSSKRLIILEYDGTFNHYITGFPPFDFGTYQQYLKVIRELEAKTK